MGSCTPLPVDFNDKNKYTCNTIIKQYNHLVLLLQLEQTKTQNATFQRIKLVSIITLLPNISIFFKFD